MVSGARASGSRFARHRLGHRHHFRRFFAGGYYDDDPYYNDYHYDYANPAAVSY